MILLSYDIEEFDMPFEYGKTIAFKDQIEISKTGTKIILDILKKHHINATFFSTVAFAQNAPELIQEIVNSGHEIASHNYYHSKFEIQDLKKSKEALEKQTGQNILGFRMPRMQPVDEKEIYNAGYIYNSSLNPTYLPGRYNNFSKPRTHYYNENVLQIPASVTPIIRFPLFWLSFHNLNLKLYLLLAQWTIKTDGYLNIYFHPWEFTNLDNKEKYNFPKYVSKNTGELMAQRMELFIIKMKEKKYQFGTFKEFISKKINNDK